MKKTITFLLIFAAILCCSPVSVENSCFYDKLTVSNLTTDNEISTTSSTIYIYNDITVDENGHVYFDDEPEVPINSIEVHVGDELRFTYENNTNQTKRIEFHIPDHTYQLEDGKMEMNCIVDWAPQVCILSCQWFDKKGKVHDSISKIFLFVRNN